MSRQTLKDLYVKWAKEEGILLPEKFEVDFGLNSKNREMLSKEERERKLQEGRVEEIIPHFAYNSDKLLTCEILKLHDIPHVECVKLSDDQEEATREVIELFHKQNAEIVIRGRRGTCGLKTFFPERKVSLPMMISTLMHDPKRPTTPLVSPRYYAKHEYGVYVVGDKVELVVKKELNPITNTHNLSTGSSATEEKNVEKLKEIQLLASKIASVFGLGFARIDVMDTTKGLKVLELSIPNFKKFALQNDTCEAVGKRLFMAAYAYSLKTKKKPDLIKE